MPCCNRAWPTCSACEHQGFPSPELRHHPRSRARGRPQDTTHAPRRGVHFSARSAACKTRRQGQANPVAADLCYMYTRPSPLLARAPTCRQTEETTRQNCRGRRRAPRTQAPACLALQRSPAPCRRQRCTPRCPRPHDTARSHAGAFPSPRPRLRRGSGTACGRSRPAPGTPAQSGSLSAS